MAEGEGFEPSIPVAQDKRLAGARTRPLCDPSGRPIVSGAGSGKREARCGTRNAGRAVREAGTGLTTCPRLAQGGRRGGSAGATGARVSVRDK